MVPPRISVSDAFDGGNIKLVGQSKDEDGVHLVELEIKKDTYTELEKKHHLQYFAFRVTASAVEKPYPVRFAIRNAGEASYPQAWSGSTVCYSAHLEEDSARHGWRRKTKTHYDTSLKVLSWTHDFERSTSVYFAYAAPFSYQRHLNLVAQCAASPLAVVESLGQSLDGREMDLVRIGTGTRTAWIIHRQHPGESQAEYFAEGLLTRLLGLDKQGEVDGTVTRIFQQYTLYIVPCMCPDGAFRGHLRTNAAGANLNREWATTQDDYEAPTLERSPEVYHVLKRMDESPPDLFLDIHADEELPVVFLAGAQGTRHWGKRMESLHGAFLAAYNRSNSDIQKAVGYTPPADPKKVVPNTATKAVATRFNCLSSTLEMPFKDCATNPNPEFGWSPNRARLLGASVLEPMLYIHPHLRAEGEFWKDFPKEDAYVHPQHREFKYGDNNEVLSVFSSGEWKNEANAATS